MHGRLHREKASLVNRDRYGERIPSGTDQTPLLGSHYSIIVGNNHDYIDQIEMGYHVAYGEGMEKQNTTD